MLEEIHQLLNEWINDEDLPKIMKTQLKDMQTQLSEIDESILTYADIQLIKQSIQVDMLKAIESYLRIPKAQAVSLIIKDNKTAKDIVIESIQVFVHHVQTIMDTAIKNQSLLLSKVEISTPLTYQKIDFFDQ